MSEKKIKSIGEVRAYSPANFKRRRLAFGFYRRWYFAILAVVGLVLFVILMIGFTTLNIFLLGFDFVMICIFLFFILPDRIYGLVFTKALSMIRYKRNKRRYIYQKKGGVHLEED